MSNYNISLTKYRRYKTREVNIGGVWLGGNYPIRVQSMTTTDTMDTKATVEQSIRIIEAGADYVRITAPAVKDAENLANIKKELRTRGYNTPLIADIHFVPKAAELAAKIVEKVRVNPGNYADRKKFKVFEFTDAMYDEELERIGKEFAPLVKICKEHGTAMRIGTNHGSLSDRIMNRYGDTPKGMVESALEFVRICEDMDYHDIVLSMKSSNPKVMVQAYRLLVKEMNNENMNYPIHLGVTEAGDGLDGRIKSSLGIGALLEDGIGDTIRVSLTEDPEAEIPVAKELVKRYESRANHKEIPDIENYPIDPFNYSRRVTKEVERIGKERVPVVIINAERTDRSKPEELADISYKYDTATDKWKIGDTAPEYIYLGWKDIEYELPGTLRKVFDHTFWKNNKNNSIPLFTAKEYTATAERSYTANFVKLSIDDITDELLEKIKNDEFCVIVLESNNEHAMAEMRRVFAELINRNIECPVIIKRDYRNMTEEQVILYAATDIGGLLIEGLGDGVWLEADIPMKVLNDTVFGILQASRTRISKTEYIACPSCGRTQFDLMETTQLIREKTNHLKGLKIAIMGCIVNGPGEMADADYGYVGTGPGFIALYKGKEVVQRGIPSEQAPEKLIELIKQNGDWVEKN